MTTVIIDDLIVTGAMSAANIIFGSLVVSPQTNTPTASEVNINHPTTAAANTMLTAVSQFPQSKLVELGTRFSDSTGFTAYVYRTNDIDTTIFWLSWQEPNL